MTHIVSTGNYPELGSIVTIVSTNPHDLSTEKCPIWCNCKYLGLS